MTRTQARNQLRRRVRDYPSQDTLVSSITAGDTSLVFTIGSYAGAPQVIEIGSELIYVGSYTSSTKTAANLVRGYLGTTAATASAGAAILHSPRYSAQDINDSLNNAIDRMSSLGLYRMLTTTLTYDASVRGYPLPVDAQDVYEVRAQLSGPEKSWPRVKAFEVAHDLPAADFSTTKAIILGGAGEAGQSVQVRYRARYGTFTDDSTDSAAATIGLQTYAADTAVVGALCELLSSEEVKRTQVDSAQETQRAQDVPVRAGSSLYGQTEQRFTLRVKEIARDLQRQYPPSNVYSG